MRRIAQMLDPKRVAWLFIFLVIQVVSMLAIPTLSAEIIDNGVATGDIEYIIKYGAIMIGIALIGFASAIFAVYLSSTESQAIGARLREQLFDQILNFTNEEIDQFGTSTLMTRTTSDVLQIQQVLVMALRFLIMDPLRILVAATLAFTREPKLAFIFIVIVPLLIFFIVLILRKVNPLFRSLQIKTDKLNRIFREGLTGIRVIRAFNREEYEEDRFDEANEDYAQTSITAHIYMSFLNPLMILLTSATSIMIIWFGAQYISVGEMEVGNLVAFTSYSFNILMGIMMLSMIITMLPRMQVAIERVYQVLDAQNEIVDTKRPAALDADAKEVSLAFNHVDFRYPGAEKLALKDIDFSLKEGEKIAIIGGTGAGKTTLANLILRLYDIDSGSIEINGLDIRHVTQHDLREMIGFATQNALLFSGTIRENLQYGNEEATDEELWHALDVAQGSDFVSNLPNGLDSRVEQGGANFSGGQRQRLSIARALATDARILVFDDSFSALDFKTDAQLRKALEPETEDKAVIIIAQRISTVVDADEILVLDKGELAGIGTHEELKESNKVYQEIIESQMKGEDI
ncbi:MAG TPA: ABC transporter ATP-binding protein/permease [Candidatus Atopostipes pullistercoris]|uniref:ABC transporter ATP-binding protein/permease n=1 Tax=Candidatus Atopostipes pullistercoris TaxID=2838467 RepID=A0A9D2JXR0_9LACT|nr:ABC transporter ATP-binding protein/permease [Candidatus Atopostipes pullistercoris]